MIFLETLANKEIKQKQLTGNHLQPRLLESQVQVKA